MKQKVVGLWLFVGLVTLFAARPFRVDDAGIVAAGGYELEGGIDYQDGEGLLSLGLTHGLTGKMAIGIGFGYAALIQEAITNRFQPAELCLKYSFLPDLFAASMTYGFEDNAYALNGILSRSWNNLSFNANIGAEVSPSTITYGLSLIYEVPSRLSLGMETTGDKNGFNAWLLGLDYALWDWLAMDAGFASDYDFEEKTVTFGFHTEF